jgi:cytochrome c oxidase cbb3-type subunit III
VNRRLTTLCLLSGAAILVSACERETRDYHRSGAAATRPDAVHLTDLVPGEPRAGAPARSPYQDNAYGMGEGKRLYSAFNCNGCHAMGGGGMGPALMDDKWIYGSSPEQIYSTIVQGRPDGMPAFGDRIPDQQVWQLVAYVQSLSGQAPKDAAPSRDDDLAAKKPESRKEQEQPKQTGHR